MRQYARKKLAFRDRSVLSKRNLGGFKSGQVSGEVAVFPKGDDAKEVNIGISGTFAQ